VALVALVAFGYFLYKKNRMFIAGTYPRGNHDDFIQINTPTTGWFAMARFVYRLHV